MTTITFHQHGTWFRVYGAPEGVFDFDIKERGGEYWDVAEAYLQSLYPDAKIVALTDPRSRTLAHVNEEAPPIVNPEPAPLSPLDR